MRALLVAVLLVVVSSSHTQALKAVPEIRDGLTLAELGITEVVRLDSDNAELSLPVLFEPGFEQGTDGSWLAFRIHFLISYPDNPNLTEDQQADIEHILSASLGNSTAVQIVAKRENGELRANGIGWLDGTVTISSTDDSVEMNYSNYFPDSLLPDKNTNLRIAFEVSDRANNAYVEVQVDSGFLITTRSPDALVLDIADIQFNQNDTGAVAVIRYSFGNARPFDSEIDIAFIPDVSVATNMIMPTQKHHVVPGYGLV